jgi:hypothetical protein
VDATEITACIINTKAKDNKVYYVFPTTSTKLICDHSRDASLTLVDLYEDGWRLANLFGPVPANQSKTKPIYNPPILYLERAPRQAPSLSLKPLSDPSMTDEKPALPSSGKSSGVSEPEQKEVAEEPEREERGGFFDWLAPKLDIDEPAQEEPEQAKDNDSSFF